MDFQRPEIYRPPSEHACYFLPLTGGCSNNTCTFCGCWGTKLQIREMDDVKKEVDAVALYMKTHVRLPNIHPVAYMIAKGWDGKKIFLQDADALVYPYKKLTEILKYTNEKMPYVERISCYATPQDILRRSPDELRELKDLKLSIFYTGLESGDDKVLADVVKGVDSRQMVEAGRKAIDAGITLSLTVLLGLAGIEGSEKHALETARILTEIDPHYVGALTLTLFPDTILYKQWEQGAFHPISAFRSLEELKIIIENSSFSNCFFSSMHASNYLSVRGRLPQDKAKMLRQLEQVLAVRDPNMLKPEYLRGM
jgi:radical SAM superfamily enzyme YgiQ (UPF0313 family)